MFPSSVSTNPTAYHHQTTGQNNFKGLASSSSKLLALNTPLNDKRADRRALGELSNSVFKPLGNDCSNSQSKSLDLPTKLNVKLFGTNDFKHGLTQQPKVQIFEDCLNEPDWPEPEQSRHAVELELESVINELTEDEPDANLFPEPEHMSLPVSADVMDYFNSEAPEERVEPLDAEDDLYFDPIDMGEFLDYNVDANVKFMFEEAVEFEPI